VLFLHLYAFDCFELPTPLSAARSKKKSYADAGPCCGVDAEGANGRHTAAAGLSPARRGGRPLPFVLAGLGWAGLGWPKNK